MQTSYGNLRLVHEGELSKEVMAVELDGNQVNSEEDTGTQTTENDIVSQQIERAPPNVSSLIASRVTGRPQKGIGNTDTGTTEVNEYITSNEQEVSRQVENLIGSAQGNARRMECAPPWVVRKALHKEQSDN